MKEINLEVLKDAANRLMFDMSPEEYQTLLEEFKVLTKQMETIGKIEGLDEMEPMTFPFPCETSSPRDDVADVALPRDEALKNAGNVQDHQTKLPKVVG